MARIRLSNIGRLSLNWSYLIWIGDYGGAVLVRHEVVKAFRNLNGAARIGVLGALLAGRRDAPTYWASV